MEKEVAHRQRLKKPPRIEQSAGILKHEMIIKMEMKYINIYKSAIHTYNKSGGILKHEAPR